MRPTMMPETAVRYTKSKLTMQTLTAATIKTQEGKIHLLQLIDRLYSKLVYDLFCPVLRAEASQAELIDRIQFHFMALIQGHPDFYANNASPSSSEVSMDSAVESSASDASPWICNTLKLNSNKNFALHPIMINAFSIVIINLLSQSNYPIISEYGSQVCFTDFHHRSVVFTSNY